MITETSHIRRRYLTKLFQSASGLSLNLKDAVTQHACLLVTLSHSFSFPTCICCSPLPLTQTLQLSHLQILIEGTLGATHCARREGHKRVRKAVHSPAGGQRSKHTVTLRDKVTQRFVKVLGGNRKTGAGRERCLGRFWLPGHHHGIWEG